MLYAIAMGQICLLACPIDNTRRFCRETDAVTQRQANDEEEDRHAKVITEPVFQRNVYVWSPFTTNSGLHRFLYLRNTVFMNASCYMACWKRKYYGNIVPYTYSFFGSVTRYGAPGHVFLRLLQACGQVQLSRWELQWSICYDIQWQTDHTTQYHCV